MTLPPKNTTDLALAPVAAHIDINLQEFRDKSPKDVGLALALQLDRPPIPNTPEERKSHVLRAALRNVEMHHWTGSITDDNSRLHLDGGSVSIDLGLSASITHYIEAGEDE
ncbi:MAG TPA: hypothetical protein VMU39_29745 [Solirubrobacteraceae bacterium]|nr:hypothetical protein [Solirubrobacteraceae bacterium]